MKNGQKVAVCQDGKWGRAKLGIVTKTRNGHHIKVKFSDWQYPEGKEPELVEVEHWFKVHNLESKYGGMRKRFSGWCDTPNAWCPWYSIISLRKITATGLRIEGVNV